METLDFYSLKPGKRVYVLGRSMHGSIHSVVANRHGKNRTVTVQFDDGSQVTYFPRQFAGVASSEPAPGHLPKPPRPKPRITQQPQPVSEGPKEPRRTRRRQPVEPVRPSRQRRQAAQPAQAVISGKRVKETRVVPTIPGPPVPKPKRGVWEHK